MLKHILVPLDRSKLSEQALDYARRVVDPAGRLTLMTAVEPPVPAVTNLFPDPNEYRAMHLDLLEDAEIYLENKRDVVKDAVANVICEAHAGMPATAILEVAHDLAVDAIVMSTHGRTGISRWVFGSVTQKVLAEAPCPVFVIPARKVT
ncbi:MAG: universal stress protein [Anaerolineales bacterium]